MKAGMKIQTCTYSVLKYDEEFQKSENLRKTDVVAYHSFVEHVLRDEMSGISRSQFLVRR